MSNYLIIKEGHQGVANVESEVLGSCEANSSKEALHNFHSNNPDKLKYDISSDRFFLPCGIHETNRLYVYALPKPDEELVRKVANLIWRWNIATGWNPSGGLSESNWSNAEITIAMIGDRLDSYINSMEMEINARKYSY